MMPIAISARGFTRNNIAEAAKVARDAGIANIEVPQHLAATADEARSVRRLLLNEGVHAAIYAATADFSPAKVNAFAGLLDQSVACAEALGAAVVNLYCASYPGIDAAAARKLLVQTVTSRIAKRQGSRLVFALENELSPTAGVANTVQAWLDIARSAAAPSFRLTLDLANFVASGETTIFEHLEPAWPFIGHVHLKDIAPYDRETEHRFPNHQVFQGKENQFLAVPLGHGMIEQQRIIGKLIELKYAGRLTLESFSGPESLAISLAYLKRIQNQAERAGE